MSTGEHPALVELRTDCRPRTDRTAAFARRLLSLPRKPRHAVACRPGPALRAAVGSTGGLFYLPCQTCSFERSCAFAPFVLGLHHV